MQDLLPEPIKTDPCHDLKAKLAEIEATIERLNQERENLIDDIDGLIALPQDGQEIGQSFGVSLLQLFLQLAFGT